MARIAFFCIPAFGHTNPTIPVVRALVEAGNEVWYYSFEMFRSRIEATGAKFIPCDEYNYELHMSPEEGARVGADVGLSIRVLTESTLSLDDMACRAMEEFKPDCIIADSMAVWGKFIAWKRGIPFISSTTTFAFNRYSARIMKPSFSQFFSMIVSAPSINRDLRRLRAKGYPVKNMLSILQNDENTDTIVYTSSLFQPSAETFGPRYAFVGPSIDGADTPPAARDGKHIYISMGTVTNRLPAFYQACLQAFAGRDYQVTLSVGAAADIGALGTIPENFDVRPSVNQLAVLRSADVFLSHCGMNSVNESLYYEVPLVMYPQTAEQAGVANRVAQLGAGVFLRRTGPDDIRAAVEGVLSTPSYRENAARISESFKAAGGAPAAAKAIMSFIGNHR